ncbi:Fpg/Nei family DNA glycosylase [Streptomyces cacaoi]|uniref:Fpg/Nei family DNA glycosylase n=1 Tax=Streptomyces cacaoi TaxID=1898 RepID=UPI003318EFD0
MPELPDVEGFRRTLDSCARGRTIRQVAVQDAGVLHGVSTEGFRKELEKRRFTESDRRGKWLLAHTGGPTVLMHFGMTGRLVCAEPDDTLHAHDRITFTLTGGHQLRYRDQRKLKGLWLADRQQVADLLDEQGPDALSISSRDFDEVLSAHHGGLKSTLTNQSVLAGLGNLLADEILWHARLAPSLRVQDLSPDERATLYKSMGQVLKASVREGCVPPRDNWLTGHRDNGVCPRCGTQLRTGRVAGRGTVWCPHCQPSPDQDSTDRA